MRYIAGLLFSIALWSVLAPAQAEPEDPWPLAPALKALETPYGTLSVRDSSYVYESVLALDGQEIEPPIQGLISISYAYKVGPRSVVLISVDSGDPECAVRYHWIALSKSGYQVTEAFGSCSPKIRVEVQGQTLVLETPDADAPDRIDRWSYNGRSVKKRRR